MNRYQAEDEDELSLEVGDTVQVIEYEDPEEQVFWYMFLPSVDFITINRLVLRNNSIPPKWSRRKVGWWALKRQQGAKVYFRPISLDPSEVKEQPRTQTWKKTKIKQHTKLIWETSETEINQRIWTERKRSGASRSSSNDLKRLKKTQDNIETSYQHTLLFNSSSFLYWNKREKNRTIFFFPFLVWKVLIRSDALSFHHRPPLLPYFFKEEWDVFTSALLPPFSQWS